LFDERFFSRSGRKIPDTSWPRVDIVENKEGYLLHADVPGMDKKDISITVENNVLTIHGEKKNISKQEKDGFSYYEREYGTFNRSFRLPAHVDAKKIHASLRNGVLELSMEKAEETKPRSTSIPVK